MLLLRTPADRFATLPDFDYLPRFAEVPDGENGTLRMAYVEAGPAQGRTHPVIGRAGHFLQEDAGGRPRRVRRNAEEVSRGWGLRQARVACR